MALASKSDAQLLNNKLNIYAGYSFGMPSGRKYIDNGSFQFPSLFSNLNFKAISVQGLYKVNKFMSAGIRVESMKGVDWDLNSSTIYNGAEASFIFLSPVIQVHNSFQENGVLNRLKLYLNIQPIFGQASITIKNPLSGLQYEGLQIFETGLSDQPNTFGVSASGGIEFNINQKTGIYTVYSFVQHWLQSSLSMDADFELSKIEIGFYYRFLKNKRYYY